MTDIEEKALALLNEVLAERVHWQMTGTRAENASIEALCRAIEQHEAFRQEVSDVASVCAQHFCKQSWTVGELLNRQDHVAMLTRFIIPAPKSDPLIEVLKDFGYFGQYDADDFCAALEARGLEIREKV